MAINTGVIEATLDTSGPSPVVVRIYYDPTLPAGPSQPLVNGPRGFCLDLTNLSGGRPVRLVVSRPSGVSQTITAGTGDPVTTGPASGRSRTAPQMASLGFVTRGDVQEITLGVA